MKYEAVRGCTKAATAHQLVETLPAQEDGKVRGPKLHWYTAPSEIPPPRPPLGASSPLLFLSLTLMTTSPRSAEAGIMVPSSRWKSRITRERNSTSSVKGGEGGRGLGFAVEAQGHDHG